MPPRIAPDKLKPPQRALKRNDDNKQANKFVSFTNGHPLDTLNVTPTGSAVVFMKRIDTHQHFWQLSRGDYSWLAIAKEPDGLDPIRRDFMPEDLFDQLSQHGVEKDDFDSSDRHGCRDKFFIKFGEST